MKQPYWRVVVTDILGVLLIIASGLFGWIPGPGGIPLFLAGLGLLSINHNWARRWLEKLKENGGKLSSKFFSEHPVIKLLIDVVGVALLALAVYLINTKTHNLAKAFAISATFTGLGLLLGNRKRLQRLVRAIKRQR